MLDGWIICGSQGSRAIRPASISARMSRSESSTRPTLASTAGRRRTGDEARIGTMAPVTFHRYVALGDSFTEGVGDPDPTRPNGLRGWADRVAEVLAQQTDDFGYANLAIRGRKLRRHPRPSRSSRPSRSQPDLVTIHGGGNDVLRPRVDIDALAADVRRRDRAARRQRRARRRCSPSSTRAPAGSTARCAAGWRSSTSGSARSPTATARRLVDMWRMRDIEIAGVMDTDRMHLNAAGHTHMARRRPRRPRRRARPRPRHRRPAPRARSPRDLGRQRAVDPRVPRALGAPPAHRPLLGRHVSPKRSRPAPACGRAGPVTVCQHRPAVPGRHCGCSSVGRARPSQGRCREFESRHPLHVRLGRSSAWPTRIPGPGMSVTHRPPAIPGSSYER